MRVVWAWLSRRRPTAEPAIDYDPKVDPLVRHFREQKLAAHRATHRSERRRRQNFMERELRRGRDR